MAPRKTPKQPANKPTPEVPVEAMPAEVEAAGVPDGVLITKEVDEQGNLKVNVVPVGSVQITEVQTIVEIGLRFFREQIGLGQAPR